eukprot:1176243-Prorocentrum_minimum.AAC.2
MVSSSEKSTSTRTSSRLQALGAENNGGVTASLVDEATGTNRDSASEGTRCRMHTKKMRHTPLSSYTPPDVLIRS